MSVQQIARVVHVSRSNPTPGAEMREKSGPDELLSMAHYLLRLLA